MDYPPSDPSIRHEFVEANGLRFHVAACGEGDRLALLLHGFPESWYSWRHQMPLLASMGWRVWAPDMRGYGETDRPPRMQDYAIEKLMEDIAALIDASRAKQVMLAGHDWGGLVAWFFAIRRIRPLDRFVILNIPHPGAGREAFGWKQRLRSLYALFFQLPWLPEKLLGRRDGRVLGEVCLKSGLPPERFPEEAVAYHRKLARQPGAITAMLNYYRALVRGGGMKRQQAQGMPVVETPTLMMWGTGDVALTVETTFATHRWVKDLTLRYLPATSHWSQQHEPERVNAMWKAWLEGEPVPEADAPGRLAPAPMS